MSINNAVKFEESRKWCLFCLKIVNLIINSIQTVRRDGTGFQYQVPSLAKDGTKKKNPIPALKTGRDGILPFSFLEISSVSLNFCLYNRP